MKFENQVAGYLERIEARLIREIKETTDPACKEAHRRILEKIRR